MLLQPREIGNGLPYFQHPSSTAIVLARNHTTPLDYFVFKMAQQLNGMCQVVATGTSLPFMLLCRMH